ncbi:hypothetical protein GOP47_0013528 [Adiantum capillus-veneris]|uniref:Uncharacterized protein n=1 Tax=Adiantum capillus-veneris TaxID=13818 RepID=A0A9D4UPN2_ADICA|nr:hypothetical protein GOP47_0013528 [Adiantum capillus-veneris]
MSKAGRAEEATRRSSEDGDDTESFNEEECLFAEGEDLNDDEWHQGPFAYYSRRPARPSSFHKPVQHHHHEDDLNALRISGHVHQMRPHSDSRPECALFSSYDERSSTRRFGAASPDAKPTLQRTLRGKKSSRSVRESLLAEAWERKRGLMLSEELASSKERTFLGQSSSDCEKQAEANVQGLCHEPRRSGTRSLTDDDFEELQGCIDLGFRFDQSAIPDLCETLPALEVYCAVAQSLQESPILNSPVRQSPTQCSLPSPTASWRVASPGDDPKDVKDRLRHWAQAVACNARLCC